MQSLAWNQARMPVESKQMTCDECGSLAEIKYVQVPTVGANVYIGGRELLIWSRVIECPNCGIREENWAAKLVWDSRN